MLQSVKPIIEVTHAILDRTEPALRKNPSRGELQYELGDLREHNVLFRVVDVLRTIPSSLGVGPYEFENNPVSTVRVH